VPRPVLSDRDEEDERDSRSRLRSIDARLRSLDAKRHAILQEFRKLSDEQRALYDRRQEPAELVERLYAEHGALGKRLAQLRVERTAARSAVDEAVVALRELRLSFDPGERVRPDQLRREIAELELRQQTRALPIAEENALIALLRQRHQELKVAEARTAVVAEHERQRREAEGRIVAARAEVERLGAELAKAKADRDAKMAEVRAKLVDAGGVVAQLRAKGQERAAVMAQIDAIEREIHDLERDGRRTLEEMRSRRDEARRTVRAYAPRRGSPTSAADSAAEANLQELLKRGKVTLGG
jgi:colicin import membrane protein